MLKPCVAADQGNSAVAQRAHHFPIEVFDKFSRADLLVILMLMHRLLDADGRRDVNRLVTELPALLASHTGEGGARCDKGVTNDVLGEHPERSRKITHLLTYLYSCLSKAQTRKSLAEIGQVASARRAYHLSPREFSVLSWIKEGKTNWEIARILGLSERTVRFHARSIFEKLDVTSRTQAVVRGLEAGLLAP